MNKVCIKEEIFENLLNLALKNCQTHNKISVKPHSFISVVPPPSTYQLPTFPSIHYCQPFGCCPNSNLKKMNKYGSNC
jgi:hypothetical protein